MKTDEMQQKLAGKPKFNIGCYVIVDRVPGQIEEYDEEDSTYKVCFAEGDFRWVDETDICKKK